MLCKSIGRLCLLIHQSLAHTAHLPGFRHICRRLCNRFSGLIRCNLKAGIDNSRKGVKRREIKPELPDKSAIHRSPGKCGDQGNTDRSIPEQLAGPAPSAGKGLFRYFSDTFFSHGIFKCRKTEEGKAVGTGQEICRGIRLKMQVILPVHYKISYPLKIQAPA